MSRLIDADLLRAEFTGNFREMWHYTGIWAMIDCVPTAYDIDKVIKELEEELTLADAEKIRCSRENLLQVDTARGYAVGIYNAIKFIKGGDQNA